MPVDWILLAAGVTAFYAAVLGCLGLIESFIGERRTARSMCLPCIVSWLLCGTWFTVPLLWRGRIAEAAAAGTACLLLHAPGLIGAARS